MVCFLCSVAYFNSLWISRRWVEWIVHIIKNLYICLVYFLFCFFHALLLISMHCGFLGSEFNGLSMHILEQLSVSSLFVLCLCHTLLLISMHCGVLVGEFRELSTFWKNSPCLVHFVSCFFHALLLTSMHYGFEECEFSELSTIWNVLFVLCLVFPCSVAYFNALWISSVWVQWIVHSLKQISLSCSLCGLFFHALLLISMHCGFLGCEFSELSTF